MTKVSTAALAFAASMLPLTALAGNDPATETADAAERAALVDEAVMDAGRAIFTEAAEPQCAICHTLADAEAEGEIGPVLDDEKPSASQVLAAVKSGLGVMPSYEVILTQEEMRSVALYVAAASGGALDLPAAE